MRLFTMGLLGVVVGILGAGCTRTFAREAVQPNPLLHPSETLRTSEKVTIEYHTQVVGVRGTRRLEGLRLRSGSEEREVAADALFVFIGQTPRSAWLDGLVRQWDEQRRRHGGIGLGLRPECPGDRLSLAGTSHQEHDPLRIGQRR